MKLVNLKIIYIYIVEGKDLSDGGRKLFIGNISYNVSHIFLHQ